jgi:hypothetical protein
MTTADLPEEIVGEFARELGSTIDEADKRVFDGLYLVRGPPSAIEFLVKSPGQWRVTHRPVPTAAVVQRPGSQLSFIARVPYGPGQGNSLWRGWLSSHEQICSDAAGIHALVVDQPGASVVDVRLIIQMSPLQTLYVAKDEATVQ